MTDAAIPDVDCPECGSGKAGVYSWTATCFNCGHEWNVAAVPISELEEVLNKLRSAQHGKQESANKSTSARSKKYNQGAAYAYCIGANEVEELIDQHTTDP
jgi:hypothetical protein